MWNSEWHEKDHEQAGEEVLLGLLTRMMSFLQ
jgi:hypothetical protein